MRPLEKVLASLDAVRRSGDQFTARCPGPAHSQGDQLPSLSIKESPMGKVLLFCHREGCQTEDVLKALGLTWKDLSENGSDKNDNSSPINHPMKNSPARITKTYDYTDVEGDLLFQVVRFDPKDFRQRRPDGKGGWIWNLKGVQRVLYRLPEISKAVRAGRTIYIVEGEKDVESLEKLGFAATCNPMGAGKWIDEYSGYTPWGECRHFAR